MVAWRGRLVVGSRTGHPVFHAEHPGPRHLRRPRLRERLDLVEKQEQCADEREKHAVAAQRRHASGSGIGHGGTLTEAAATDHDFRLRHRSARPKRSDAVEPADDSPGFFRGLDEIDDVLVAG
jgi:hypothetical protein